MKKRKLDEFFKKTEELPDDNEAANQNQKPMFFFNHPSRIKNKQNIQNQINLNTNDSDYEYNDESDDDKGIFAKQNLEDHEEGVIKGDSNSQNKQKQKRNYSSNDIPADLLLLYKLVVQHQF